VFDRERDVRPFVVADMLCYNRSGFRNSDRLERNYDAVCAGLMRWRWFRRPFIDE
jgi:hypothetical protein